MPVGRAPRGDPLRVLHVPDRRLNAPVLSAVLPVKDEAGSLPLLHAELVGALERAGVPWEIVYVDDGSTDGSAAVMARLAAAEPRVRPVRLARNYGQSTAIVAGAEAARGRWIVTMDADGQIDPADLLPLWRAVERGEADAAIGVRTTRRDTFVRRASSRVGNAVRDRLSGDRVTDVGCSLRVLPREGLLGVVRFEGMHRFLPTLLRMRGCSVVEVPVSHRPRSAGRSKYGISNRIFRGLGDLLVVRRLRQRRIDYEVAGPGPGGRGSAGGDPA